MPKAGARIAARAFAAGAFATRAFATKDQKDTRPLPPGATSHFAKNVRESKQTTVRASVWRARVLCVLLVFFVLCVLCGERASAASARANRIKKKSFTERHETDKILCKIQE